MQYLKVENVKKAFGNRTLFQIERLYINEFDKIGFIGSNGSGKTTLLSILAHIDDDYSGIVICDVGVSYFKQFEDSDDILSGGQRVKRRLGSTLNKRRHLYLFDEPTANLDNNGIEYFENELDKLDTYLIVSHDVTLLRKYCNRIFEIIDETLIIFEGNYDAYMANKELQAQTKQHEYDKYVNEKERLESVIEAKKQKAESILKKPKGMSKSEYRSREFLASRSYRSKQQGVHRAVKHVEKRLEHLEVKELYVQDKIAFDLTLRSPLKNKVVIEAEDVSFAYGKHQVLKHVSFHIENSEKVALVGSNGSGKTTLLKLIYDNGVRLVPQAKITILTQDFDNLNYDKSLFDNLRENSLYDQAMIRTILKRLKFHKDSIFKSVSYLSGGEKVKAMIAKLTVSDYNILLLDEPTNYLDIESKQAILQLLLDYPGTVLFVSHDRDFVERLATRKLVLEKGQLKVSNKSFIEDNAIEKMKLEMRLAQLMAKTNTKEESEEINKIIVKLKNDN